MTYLSYNTELRTETNQDLIATLLRKGWTENPPPSYDPATQHPPAWSQGQWSVTDKTPEELAADARKVWPTSAKYLLEFTLPEMSAISLSEDPTIAALRLLLATWDTEVWSDDPRVVAGLDAIQAAGIIDAARRAQILAKDNQPNPG
jgi:hypothetical protein